MTLDPADPRYAKAIEAAVIANVGSRRAWEATTELVRRFKRQQAADVLAALEAEGWSLTDTREVEAICNRCRAPKGLHAVGQSCNNNCGGRVIANPATRPTDDTREVERLREALREMVPHIHWQGGVRGTHNCDFEKCNIAPCPTLREALSSDTREESW